MNRVLVFSVCIGIFALCGCSISRSVVNPHHCRHDTSWIVPGKTTKTQVVERLGMPPHEVGGRGGVRDGSFRYLVRDTYTGTLEVGRFVTPTFEVAHERHGYDLLIKFDSEDRVVFVSCTESVDGQVRVLDFREAK